MYDVDKCRINRLVSATGLVNVNPRRWPMLSTSRYAKRARMRHERFAIAQRDAAAESAMEITRILHIIGLHAPPTYSLTWRMARIEYAAILIKSRRKQRTATLTGAQTYFEIHIAYSFVRRCAVSH